MTKKQIGVTLFAIPKKPKFAGGEECRVLSYGTGKQPHPDQLLFDRGVTVFPDEKTAMAALDESLTIEDRLGSIWHRRYLFSARPAYVVES